MDHPRQTDIELPAELEPGRQLDFSGFASLLPRQRAVDAHQTRRRFVFTETVERKTVAREAQNPRRDLELERNAVARRPAQHDPVHPARQPQRQETVLLQANRHRRPAVDQHLGRHKRRRRPRQCPGRIRRRVDIRLDPKASGGGLQLEPRQLHTLRRTFRRTGDPTFELLQKIRPRTVGRWRHRGGRRVRLLFRRHRPGPKGRTCQQDTQQQGGGDRRARFRRFAVVHVVPLGSRPAAPPAQQPGDQPQEEHDAGDRQDQLLKRRNEVEPQHVVGLHRPLPDQIETLPAPRRHPRTGLHHRVGIDLAGAFRRLVTAEFVGNKSFAHLPLRLVQGRNFLDFIVGLLLGSSPIIVGKARHIETGELRSRAIEVGITAGAPLPAHKKDQRHQQRHREAQPQQPPHRTFRPQQLNAA